MPAYILCLRDGPVRNQAEMDLYSQKTRQGPRNPDLTPLVIYGATQALEGEAPDGTIVLKFPTVEAAQAWYNSPTYQAAIPHRQKAGDYRMFIVEGL